VGVEARGFYRRHAEWIATYGGFPPGGFGRRGRRGLSYRAWYGLWLNRRHAQAAGGVAVRKGVAESQGGTIDGDVALVLADGDRDRARELVEESVRAGDIAAALARHQAGRAE
jgi:hypothetical protein